MNKWRIEYDNTMSGGFGEWWDVTNGTRYFRCDNAADADWLLDLINLQNQINRLENKDEM